MKSVLAAALAGLLPLAALAQPQSGLAYQSAETKALQADDFANPGMLWVERGESIWKTPDAGTSKPCAACHGDAASTMKGVAARYPRHDPASGRVLDLEERINACRERHVGAPAYVRESDSLLALTAFVAHQSRGMPVSVETGGAAGPALERGRVMFEARQGQMNLACRHCHDDNAGRMLRGDKISQGMPNGYPTYRLEWQKLGSLQRRLRACFVGVRAEPYPFGAQEMLDLSLFLAARAGGLTVETPAVRR